MTRTSSDKILAWLLISACVVAVGPSCRSKQSTDDKAVGSKDDALRLDLRPTYGPLGRERPSTFIAGELLCFAAAVSGIRATSEGKYDCDYEYAFTDPSGKEVVRDSDHVRDLFLGGGESAWPISIKSEMSASPGRHMLRLSVRDNVTGQAVEKTLRINILDKNRFFVLNACLYCDPQHSRAVGGNVTAGGRVYAKCHVRVPKNQNNESRAETVITLHDRDNKTIYIGEPLRIENTNPTGSGAEFAFYDDFLISDVGLYHIHIATKDLSTGATRQCDLPLLVHASPEAPVVQAGSAGRKRQGLAEPSPPLNVGEEDALSLEVHPTLGYLGCPCDAHIAQGRELSFAVTVRGLSTGADGKAGCVVTLSAFGPALSAPFRETFSETAKFLSKDLRRNNLTDFSNAEG